MRTHWRYIKSYHVNEILKAVRRNAPRIDPSDLNRPDKRIIVFKNGVFNLRTGQMEPFSPHYRYTIGIPHNFNAKAKCPKFDQFMAEILPLTDHPVVAKILGYLLIPSAEFRKFFNFPGSGANGKSTLIEVTIGVLGRGNVSHQSLHDLAGNRFSASELYGKLANTYADLDARDVQQTGLLKQITAGDSLQYQKKFKDPFFGPVTARLVFSANQVPTIHENSEAIRDRLVLVEFPNRIPAAEQDSQLISKLTTQAELEGIIAKWAVPALLRLLKGEDSFPLPPADISMAPSDGEFSKFVAERVEPHSGGCVRRTDLYQAYGQWYSADAPLSQKHFNERVAQTLNLAPNYDYREPGTKNRAWPRIRLKPKTPQVPQGKSTNKEQMEKEEINKKVLKTPGVSGVSSKVFSPRGSEEMEVVNG